MFLSCQTRKIYPAKLTAFTEVEIIVLWRSENHGMAWGACAEGHDMAWHPHKDTIQWFHNILNKEYSKTKPIHIF